MKTILVLLFLLYSNFIFGFCFFSFEVWPKFIKLPQNPILILEAEEIIDELNKKYPIYLESSTEKIPLKILKINYGEYNLNQAILSPIRKLRSGMVYKLVIDSLENHYKEYINKEFSWEVGNHLDLNPPNWTMEPQFIEANFKDYGCGPAVFSEYCFCTNENTLVVVNVKIENLKTSEFYIIPNSNLKIGHDMCAGGFVFEKDQDYDISFQLVDYSGNKSNFTKPQKFINPYTKQKSNLVCNCNINGYIEELKYSNEDKNFEMSKNIETEVFHLELYIFIVFTCFLYSIQFIIILKIFDVYLISIPFPSTLVLVLK